MPVLNRASLSGLFEIISFNELALFVPKSLQSEWPISEAIVDLADMSDAEIADATYQRNMLDIIRYTAGEARAQAALTAQMGQPANAPCNPLTDRQLAKIAKFEVVASACDAISV